jgi:hypothetical protein
VYSVRCAITFKVVGPGVVHGSRVYGRPESPQSGSVARSSSNEQQCGGQCQQQPYVVPSPLPMHTLHSARNPQPSPLTGMRQCMHLSRQSLRSSLTDTWFACRRCCCCCCCCCAALHGHGGISTANTAPANTSEPNMHLQRSSPAAVQLSRQLNMTGSLVLPAAAPALEPSEAPTGNSSMLLHARDAVAAPGSSTNSSHGINLFVGVLTAAKNRERRDAVRMT